MKYLNLLLLPITGSVRYFLTYFLLFGVLTLTTIIFHFSWIWFIVSIIVLLPLFFGLIYTWIAFAMVGIQSFHKNNLVAAFVHAILGISAFISFTIFYINNQPTIGENDINVFSYMWNESKLKFIILGVEAGSMIISILFSSIINPFMFYIQSEK